MNLMRSLIFVPGNRKDMLGKSLSFGADFIVPDMQDSVPVAEKETARDVIHDMIPVLSDAGKKIVVRVNAMSTGLLEDDLRSSVSSLIYGVNIVNIEKPEDVIETDSLLASIEQINGVELGSTKLIIYLESATGIVNAYQNCLASSRIVAAAFGAEDFTVDMGTERTDAGSEVFLPRAMVAIAARAANVLPLDVVYANFRDDDGLKKDIEVGKTLGYKGKFAIHPSQVESINEILSPNAEQILYARRVIEAFEEAESKGMGATSLDGKMIDNPVVKRAQNVLDMVAEIGRES